MKFFKKFGLPFNIQKKTNLMIESPKEDIIKKEAIAYKTIANFDLDIASPRYDGDIPEATIKFYPLD